MVSSRSFIHLVLKPSRLPGFEPTQASLVDHSGLVQNADERLGRLLVDLAAVDVLGLEDVDVGAAEDHGAPPSGPVGIRP